MYKIFTANKKTEKILQKYIFIKPDIKNKLDLLKLNPRNIMEHTHFMED